MAINLLKSFTTDDWENVVVSTTAINSNIKNGDKKMMVIIILLIIASFLLAIEEKTRGRTNE